MKPITNKRLPRVRIARDGEDVMPTVDDLLLVVRGALQDLPELQADIFFAALEEIVAQGRQSEGMEPRGVDGSMERVTRGLGADEKQAFDEMFPQLTRIKSSPGPVRRKRPTPHAAPAGMPSLSELFPTVAAIRRT
jgi:hypothetical protein